MGWQQVGDQQLWRDPTRSDKESARWLGSPTVITTNAAYTLGQIHDRSPLLLPYNKWDAWLVPS